VKLTKSYKDRRSRRRKRMLTIAVAPLSGIALQHASLKLHQIPRNMTSPNARKALRSLAWEMGKKGVYAVPGTRAYFSPSANKVVYPMGKTYTGLHEYGHATMKRSSLLGAVRRMASTPGRLLFHGRTPLAVGLGAVSGGKFDEKKVALTSLALNAPVLAEEAIANIQAARAVRKAGGGLRGIGSASKYLVNMAPAYGTYAGAALGAAGLGYATAKLVKWNKKRPKKQ
jgi:hypothetical protein